MKDLVRKAGFVYKPTTKKQWVSGSKKATVRFGAVPLMPGGHGWGAYRPADELQNKNGVESYACTVFGSLKTWITLSNYLGYDLPKDCAERFSAIMAGIVPPGANPHDVCESIRTWGVVNQEALPFDDSIHSTTDFYHPNPMDEGIVAEAKKIVQKYEFGHEYIFNDPPVGSRTMGKPALLKAALERGTVCISVYAWKFNGQYYYKDFGDTDEHWVHLLDYQEGEFWLIEDQYQPFLKRVAWDTDFQTAEVYFLQPNVSGIAPNDRSLLSSLLRTIQESLSRILLQLQTK